MCIHISPQVVCVSLLLVMGACSGPVSNPTPAEPTGTVSPKKATSPATPASASKPDAGVLDLEAAKKLVAATDRSDDDRKTDARRQPAEVLAFLELKPGLHVGDIGAGYGYTTELLARAVGGEGKVYGQNTAFVLEKFAEEGWSERLQKPQMKSVTRLDREFDDPFPDELAGTLDRVINVLFYHDFVWMETDRAAHNRDVFAALKPGGLYVVIDHSAAPGAGTTGAKSLHRIEESVLRSEVEAAGFEFVEAADFLRNPKDPRDTNALPWRGGEGAEFSDKFVLKFKKPN